MMVTGARICVSTKSWVLVADRTGGKIRCAQKKRPNEAFALEHRLAKSMVIKIGNAGLPNQFLFKFQYTAPTWGVNSCLPNAGPCMHSSKS
jgi:hypothetical protein